jgi:hypothetical protein
LAYREAALVARLGCGATSVFAVGAFGVDGGAVWGETEGTVGAFLVSNTAP